MYCSALILKWILRSIKPYLQKPHVNGDSDGFLIEMWEMNTVISKKATKVSIKNIYDDFMFSRVKSKITAYNDFTCN